MTGVLIGIMIVLVALVVDIGHTRLVQRQLQAGVDAAALAAAQELPDETVAVATANEYSPTPGNKNAVNTVGNARPRRSRAASRRSRAATRATRSRTP